MIIKIRFQVSVQPSAKKRPVWSKKNFVVLNRLFWIVGAVFNRDYPGTGNVAACDELSRIEANHNSHLLQLRQIWFCFWLHTRISHCFFWHPKPET